MQKNFNFFRNEFFPIGLILILAFSRLIPHPPNFTPIIAVAIISGYFFKNINVSVLILLFAMIISDLFIGFYENIIFVYTSLIFITLVFHKISKNKFNSNFSKIINNFSIADRKVGLCLSGGLDSNLIKVFLMKVQKKINSFTIGFKEKSYDESLYVKNSKFNKIVLRIILNIFLTIIIRKY